MTTTKGLLELTYPTTIYPFGMPEERMQAELANNEPTVTYRFLGAGTELATGFRDVQIEVEGPISAINAIIEHLNADGVLAWTLRCSHADDPEGEHLCLRTAGHAGMHDARESARGT